LFLNVFRPDEKNFLEQIGVEEVLGTFYVLLSGHKDQHSQKKISYFNCR